MTNLKTYFEKSKDINTYIDEMTTNKEALLNIYNDFEMPNDDPDLESLKSSNYAKVLIISEDWCGDAMMNVPILKHIGETLALDMRVFHRDDDTNLIDQYLTNGRSRSIPIFVFLNENDEQEAVWGPRAKSAQNFVNQIFSKLPETSDPEYDDAKQSAHVEITNRFKTDAHLWKDVYQSIIDKLIKK